MAIAAGKLREQVDIEAKNLVDNGRGGRKRPDGGPEWIALAEGVRAEIIPLRGDEALTQSVLRSTQIYRVTMRNRAGITLANRLVWNGTAMNIKTCAPSVDRADLIMTCESGVPT